MIRYNINLARVVCLLLSAVSIVIPLFTSCQANPSRESKGVKVIFETDLGNDTDDAIAMDVLHKYADMGKVELLAVNVNKKGLLPAELADAINTYYGRGDIPIGVVSGTSREEDPIDGYCKPTLDSVKFERSISDYEHLLPAYKLSRKILAQQQDHSVTFISVGFCTNLASLLDSPADEYSKLTGKELVAKKVKELSIMAGIFDTARSECNVRSDAPAAIKVFTEWPTAIVVSPWEVGAQVSFRGDKAISLERFDANSNIINPVKVAYEKFFKMPYDRPMWDPTAVIYGVEGLGELFSISPLGTVSIDENNLTCFVENPEGNHRLLIVDKEHAAKTEQYLHDLAARVPERYKCLATSAK